MGMAKGWGAITYEQDWLITETQLVEATRTVIAVVSIGSLHN
jgi:hypothetical protein